MNDEIDSDVDDEEVESIASDYSMLNAESICKKRSMDVNANDFGNKKIKLESSADGRIYKKGMK